LGHSMKNGEQKIGEKFFLAIFHAASQPTKHLKEACTLTTHCLFVFILLCNLPHGFLCKRETIHSLCPQPRSLLVISENSCFFIDLIVMNHFKWI